MDMSAFSEEPPVLVKFTLTVLALSGATFFITILATLYFIGSKVLYFTIALLPFWCLLNLCIFYGVKARLSSTMAVFMSGLLTLYAGIMFFVALASISGSTGTTLSYYKSVVTLFGCISIFSFIVAIIGCVAAVKQRNEGNEAANAAMQNFVDWTNSRVQFPGQFPQFGRKTGQASNPWNEVGSNNNGGLAQQGSNGP